MHRLLLTLVVLSLSGCANLNTVNRTSSLPGGGKAVHLDSSQRLVYTNKDGMLCAEPTPDAIQAYAAAMGASAGVNDKGSAALSNALSANSASVGLHTQSITLMRDTLYRICEFSHNKAANPLDTVQLLQRSQDLTLGVLAIEQLTGAVVARQALLTSGSASTAAASIKDTEAQLKVALANEARRKTDLDDATKAERKQQSILANAQKALKAESEKDPVDETKVTKLTEAAEAAQLTLDDKTAAVTSAKAAYDRAVTHSQAIAKMYDSAIAAGTASTTGTGELSGDTSKQKVDKETAQVLAHATMQIVEMVLNKGHLTDTCMNFLTRHADPLEKTQSTYVALVNQCTKVIEAGVAQHMGGNKAQMSEKCLSFLTREVDRAERESAEYQGLAQQCTKVLEADLRRGVSSGGMASTHTPTGASGLLSNHGVGWMSMQLDEEKMKAFSEALQAREIQATAKKDNTAREAAEKALKKRKNK